MNNPPFKLAGQYFIHDLNKDSQLKCSGQTRSAWVETNCKIVVNCYSIYSKGIIMMAKEL